MVRSESKKRSMRIATIPGTPARTPGHGRTPRPGQDISTPFSIQIEFEANEYLIRYSIRIRNFEDIRYSIFDIRYSIFDIRYSIFDIRYSIFDIRYSIFDIRYSIFDIRYSIFDIRYSIFDIRYSIFDIRFARACVRACVCVCLCGFILYNLHFVVLIFQFLTLTYDAVCYRCRAEVVIDPDLIVSK